MGNCIICGTVVDGEVCASHEEDVAFEFRGTSPSQLSPGRYYRGTVDGYADFGVFVDVGDHVTGLLHRSELDQRLESLDWEPGDEVFVQVLDVRDNGNVDLGWSIRQRGREFRGKLIETADDELRPEELEDDDSESESDDSNAGDDRQTASADSEPSAANSGDTVAASSSGGTSTVAAESTGSTATTDDAVDTESTAEDEPALKRTTVDAIDTQVGSVVRLEGEITGVRQTSGPTVFELSDETGAVECAAFEEAGVRAYPSVEVEAVVALEGEVERHHGELQIETETLEVLEGEKRETIAERLESAIEREATPAEIEFLADHDAVAAVEDGVGDAATAIRRAVMEARPIVVRHGATADGYLAGAAIERAVLPLIREKHTREDAEYHYFERRPLDDHVYDMDAATDDVTSMLEARDRHGEQLPLVVLVDVGSTVESIDGYDLLSLYDANAVVVDDSHADEAITDAVEVAVTPSLDGADVSDVTSTALAANVAAHVNDDVRDEVEHLPAISYWEDTPEAYLALATEANYDETAIAERREAVALEAYYQSYKDKRELVSDLLFGDADAPEARDGDLAAHVSEQFRAKLDTELETARENIEIEEVDGITVAVLDTAAFTHRYNFPTTTLLLDELHRRQHDEGPFVTLGVGDDELHVRATESLNVRDLGDAIAEAAPDAGVRVVGGHDGYVEFLPGERAAVREAALEALDETLA
ncbi:DHH family phosphoesterase [Natronobacterium gregoryi]|uniref:DNA-binding protein n=2 Tax=Natronobacterium gregoryi TaxID=44930 RepID=L0AJ18_NATGS|nr:OB-fold nucleic acid binding domain-containing protein [Natronobacterium gregoryi]AFZ73898.1 RecJ-like exonuclease with DnaJ-type Zn-finger domain [Natronobacterium gregoryi SP2]ELY64854.1 OB-fold tRNA/helicase-type nucleic acid binding-protein [Natronobacterium gregoryi SP2]PLK19145.1 DNA-binding protein [Natronobacterium gregoryi SP2]SFJ59701.1 RecJ-like exonuclease, contains DnaJ-type Zn finger domain [Natronobacterium gregoryi]